MFRQYGAVERFVILYVHIEMRSIYAPINIFPGRTGASEL